MNERQIAEFQELQNLEVQGSLEEAQKIRLEELNTLKDLTEKTAEFSKKSKDFESALAQKEHFREKADKAEKERKALEDKLNGFKGESKSVEDFIDISTSLEGLDQKEKERVAREHKLTGKPLSEIRKDEDFLLWQSAYKAKVDKERASLIPSSKQPDDNSPISLEEALSNATSVQEKEEILKNSMGYSIGRKSNSDRVKLG